MKSLLTTVDLLRGAEWIACIANAPSVERYAEWLRGAGLEPQAIEAHNDALIEMVRQIQTKLLAAEIMTGLKKIDLPDVDLTTAKEMANAAHRALQQGQLGYAIITAHKP